MILFFFSNPPTIRSTASKKSCFSTDSLALRAAIKAASLHTLAISAPEKPGVCFARNATSTSVDSLIGLKCTLNISSRSFKSGSSTWIWRSKRPARIKARSRISARFVAANIMTPELVSKPSISVNNWLSVFSRSSFEPILTLRPLARPIASISSINTIHGAFSFACLKRSRTLDAPTPTNISTKSEPDIEKNGTFASPATALARSVFPVPGGPTSNAPFGIFPPNLVNLAGLFRKSTISSTSCLASANPATSLKLVETFESLSNKRACDFPTLKILPPPPGPPPPFLIRRKTHHQIRIMIPNGRIHPRILPR